ncbi:MAG: tetratricopeptide repeat-containing sensor histidine kinase [Patiriisocius sp.]|uniref:tetratricopeptide repeat-containing sensor histidine kinase n=1 Tax=Patiriisocius sp. TaxID=2822396 RepID=UPI003EFA65F7
MKHPTLFYLLFLGASLFAQDISSDKIVEKFELNINQSQNGERLIWMDSLSTHLREKTNFQSDSIARETVKYALELDSLEVATKNTAYLIYFQNNITGNLEEGNRIFLNFLNKAEVCRNHRALSKFYLEGADNYFYLEDQKNAIKYYNLSEREAFLGDDDIMIGLAKMYKGNALSFMGEFSEASKELQEAIQIFQKKENIYYVISARNLLSVLYSQNSFFEEAKKERDEAILLAKKIGSYGHLSAFYSNAAHDYRSQDYFKKSIENLKMALNASNKTDNPKFYESKILTDLAITYSEIDSIPQAEFYLKMFEERYKDRIENVRELYLGASKNLAFAKKDYSLALKYGKEHLKLKLKGTHYGNIQEAEIFMSKVYEALGDTRQSYIHFKKYSQIKDSIGKTKKIKALSYYQTLYETKKRDLKINEQQSNIALLDAKNRLYNQLLFFGSIALLSIFGFILVVRSRNAANRRQKMQTLFSQDLIKAQEEERIRVARDLHDSVGQKLMLLTKQTKTIGNPKMESLAENTLHELRMVSRGLHPATIDNLGVTAAIKTMINEVDANTNIFFTNEIEDIDKHLSKAASLHLYRILQELLNNMVKHAEAKVASVNIEIKKDHIKVIVKDNGKGFGFSEKLKLKATLGMRTLMERASILKATLDIKSNPNSGTKIKLIIPYKNV